MKLADVVIEALNVTQDTVLVVRIDRRLSEHDCETLRGAFAPMFLRGLKPVVLISDESSPLELERIPKADLRHLRDHLTRLLGEEAP